MLDKALSCSYSKRLINRLISLDERKLLNLELVKKAMFWAKKYHADQKRRTGEPFYTHPFEVAYMIAEYNISTNVIVTSILHDIIEDTEVTAGMILDGFGFRIAEMVDALTRDRPDGTKLSVEQILNNAYEKNDKEVLLVKLFDRLHNVMTAKGMSREKQRKLIQKTLQEFLFTAADIDINLERILVEKCYEFFGLHTNIYKNFSSSRNGSCSPAL